MKNECKAELNVTRVVFVKKGMANKALVNNLLTGNIDRIKKQVKKETVMFTTPESRLLKDKTHEQEG